MDFDERKAYVKRVDVDYYTDAIRYTQVRVLEIADHARVTARRRRRRFARFASAWRCVGALASGGLQENKILHP